MKSLTIICSIIMAFTLSACAVDNNNTANVPDEHIETNAETENRGSDAGEEPEEELSETSQICSNEVVEKAIVAYASVIEEKAAEEPFLSFTLIHLDEDDIPELVIADGDAHAGGVTFYGFDAAGVNEIYSTGSFGLAYYEKGIGIAFGWYTGQGETWYDVGIIKDGKLTEELMPVIAIQYDENYKEAGYKYYLGGENGEEIIPKDISKEKFDEILTPYAPENRQYRELEYNKLYDVHEITDIKQALRDSLEKEDNLPQPDMEFFHKNTIAGE